MAFHPVTEFDLFFLSYDEANAEMNWAYLVDLAPWAKRVQKVLGFDAVHRSAAEQSETEWFITVDADNVVMPAFFDTQVELHPTRPNLTLAWNGENILNGLIYGNGGLKLWSRKFALNMNCHERADDPTRAVDFCWLPDYEHQAGCWSTVMPNGSAQQAYRAGFREGVKLTLDRGRRIIPTEMSTKLHPVNLRNLRIWCSVGRDQPYGCYAMLGARDGWLASCDPEWNHTVINDYHWFRGQWDRKFGSPFFVEASMDEELQKTGDEILRKTGINVVTLDNAESEFFRTTMRLRNG